MTPRTAHSHNEHEPKADNHASEKTAHKQDGRGRILILIPWLIAVALALTMGLALNYGQQDRYTPAIWWGFSCWVVIGLGTVYGTLQWAAEHARPDVVMDSMYPISEPHKGFDVGINMKPVARVVIRNDGRTAAEHVFVNLTIQKRNGALPKNAIEHAKDVELPAIASGGRGYRTVVADEPLTQAEVDALNDRKLNLYVFGSVRYRKQPEFRFCYIYNPDLGRSRPYEPGTHIYEPCEQN